MKSLSIVAVNGSPSASSRTSALVDSILRAMHGRWKPSEIERIDVQVLAPDLGLVFQSPEYPSSVQRAVHSIEQADILIAASPIYRGAYTGMFKHLFDLVDQDALVGTPVLLAATGGSERHTLALDHIFRPLFSFFRASTAPTSVYVTQADFEADGLLKEKMNERIEAALRSLDWVYNVAARESLAK